MRFMLLGIRFIRDILQFSQPELEEQLGKWGAELWWKAQGIHDGEVNNEREAKSISSENTFHEFTADETFLISEVVRMTEKVAYELRQDEKLAGCVTVKIRYTDFETVSSQSSINYTYRDDEMIPVAKQLFTLLYKQRKNGAAYRRTAQRFHEPRYAGKPCLTMLKSKVNCTKQLMV